MLIPIAVGLLAGLGGGSGYAYMKASAKFAADSAFLADSLKAHPDTTAATDSGKSDSHGSDGASISELPDESGTDLLGKSSDELLAPTNDSSSSVKPNTRAPSVSGVASKNVETTPKTAAPQTSAAKTPPATANKPDNSTNGTSKVESAQSAASLIAAARETALQSPLPQQRLAKIFSTMPAKDAARVLEQMNDADIRVIISLMSDRQAASILSALPTGRAAAVTRTGGNNSTAKETTPP